MIWTVPGTGFAQLIVNAGDGPTMVINRDETHQIFVGSDNSVASKNGTGDVDVIDPLSYIVYDGIQSKYAIADTPGVEVEVNTVKGATNWAPSPAQAAVQIGLLGLATESTQQLVKTNTGDTHNTLVSGIALPVGAAKEAGNLLGIAQNAAFQTSFQGGSAASAFVANPGLTLGQEIAALIASGSATGTPGGTPLLSGFKNTAVVGPTNIGAGASGSVLFAVTNPGYIIQVSAAYIANGTVPFAEFQLIWSDAAANVIAQENWFIPVSGTGQPLIPIYGKGPTKGANVRVRFVNFDPSQTISFRFNLNQTTHHITRDDWRSDVPSGVPGQTAATCDPLSLILASQSQNFTTLGQQQNILLPLFSGQVTLNWLQTGNNLQVQVFSLDPSFISAPPVYVNTTAAPNGLATFALPRSPCSLLVTNKVSGPNTFNLCIVGTELTS